MNSTDPALPDDVGARIRAYREGRHMTGTALAERTGLSQAKVSRIETGRSQPSADDLRLMATALHLSPEETAELERLLETRRSGAIRRGGARPERAAIARQQGDVGRAEQAAAEIRIFQPTIVPGLLQTSGYAEGILRTPLRLTGFHSNEDSGEALLAAVAGRIRRQQILELPKKQFFFVMTESVLANRLVSPEDMLAQIRRIRETAERRNVSIRIIPADAPLAVAPLNSFELLDDTWVMIDVFHAFLSTQTSTDVETYRDVFDAMTKTATADIGPILDKYVEIYKAELG